MLVLSVMEDLRLLAIQRLFSLLCLCTLAFEVPSLTLLQKIGGVSWNMKILLRDGLCIDC